MSLADNLCSNKSDQYLSENKVHTENFDEAKEYYPR